MSNKLVISIILVFVSLAWAGSFVAVKQVVDEINPVDLGFLRFVFATPLIFLFLFFKKGKSDFKIIKKEFWRLVVLGLTGVTLLYIFQFVGIAYTTSSTSSVLINLNVIFIALLSGIFLRENFSIKKIFGILFSFLGVIVVISAQMTNENIFFSEMFLLGCVFIILSAFFWAIYSIVGKNLLKKYDNLTVTAYAFLLGSIFYLPFVLPDVFTKIPSMPINIWFAVLYLAIICSVFGYVGWYYALSNIPASKAAVFLNLIPLFTIIISFFIGEIPNLLFVLGAALIMTGIYITQKSV